MKYLLDTDHLSILQRQTGQDYRNLVTRMAQYPLSDFGVSIVTFHEQMLGCHAYINRDLDNVVKGYKMMMRLLEDFKKLPLVSFDEGAETMFKQLQAQRLRLAKMDARIAAIALFQGLTLLTRNQRVLVKLQS
ncbi:MAG: type II toxin-antitoxin system VapC family toxin [Jaaginema sp. PMC 1079.18]|nr:type II toxin-antitoxin system VapC family toxin [Jaaginema sp. PMC 1080.18]MEC4852711.1 type II toxin-antitoxin system VapC family toxin [Jaaginema sp. PMC 1079.18]MEC4865647.1 type II toxin-antitoxin system VapC family toxin [Jaaginema sp. PMC 1078.18]